MRFLAGLTALVLGTSSAVASDGVIEINQACADAGGCDESDAPGLPVTLSGPGSYLLTSDLNHDPVLHGSASIISVGSDVTLDLNGFTLRSTSTCQPGNCDAAAVQGVSGPFTERVTVKNGRVVGVSANCIWLGDRARVERVTLAHCALNGILVGADSVVQDVSVVATGRNGLRVQGSNTIYGGSSFSDNGLRGDDFIPDLDTSVSMDARGGEPSFCGDGLCADGRSRYYLTQGTFLGSAALSACDAGFHMASITELKSTSDLKYDTRRGEMGVDSGSGPTQVRGWIRTGYFASNVEEGGDGNCGAWTFDVGGFGTAAKLSGNWLSSIDWFGQAFGCDVARRVWCIED